MNNQAHPEKFIDHLADSHQSYWQLTVIQLAGWMSLPVFATSILVLQSNSFLGSALTILVGNAILWFIRLGIMSMSYEKRQSTLDLSREYFGNLGSYFIATVLLTSTFAWFIIQTTAASNTLTHLISIHEDVTVDQFIQVSVLLGLASTLLCMEGMVLLRYLSTFAFPILALTFLVILFSLPEGSYQNGNPLSLSGLSIVLATNLGITSDMPTFFRHSRSWNESIKALTVTQILSLVFGLASLFLGAVINGMFEVNESYVLQGSEILRFSLIIFVFVSAICTNVGNVYSSSVGWELIAPASLVGRKEYLILGLGLTTIFILISNVFSPVYLLALSDGALVNLCLIFIAAYLVNRHFKKPPSSFQKKVYFSSWTISTGANAIQFAFNENPSFSPLLLSFCIITAIILIGNVCFTLAGKDTS